MNQYVCKCGHEVYAAEDPTPIKWDDGHICIMILRPPPEPCWLCEVTYTLFESELCTECYFWAEEAGFVEPGDSEGTVKAWYAVEQMRAEFEIIALVDMSRNLAYIFDDESGPRQDYERAIYQEEDNA